ncbi:MAG: erythromycin esterase family protein [Planctomycetota bacterium]|jgi:erythromycin esterase-like protein
MPYQRLCLLLLLIAPARAQDPGPWLKEHGVAFKTVEAGHGLADLMPLKQMIGDARIVSLGESTHGSKEIFQMKHRLVEFLATEMGFTIFSIEASMPESYRVNDYVLHGRGDPRELIRGMYFWTWSTDEVLAMVEWMREFNAAGKGPLQFTGFDMQAPRVAARIVTDFVRKVDPASAESCVETYDRIAKARRGGPAFGAVGGKLPVAAARGKQVRLSGSIRTRDVKGWAGLWLRADKGKWFDLDNMQARAPHGTSDWAEYAVTVDVPQDATGVVFGVLLSGAGMAWFDGLKVEMGGEEYKDAERYDLDFEAGELRGLGGGAAFYRHSLDREAPRSGEQCLKLERVAAPETKGFPPREAAQLASRELERLRASRDAYVEKTSEQEVEWALQNARVVLQCMQSRARMVPRDQSMAANVAWIARQNPEAKLILWAHNGHVARGERRMGGYLHETFGARHLPVGFATREGKYWAVGQKGRGMGAFELQAPPAGSWEALLAQTGQPRLLLDLRKAPDALRAGRLFRAIGALEMTQQFFPHPVPDHFDILIYIEKTSAAVQMSR